MIFKAYLFTLRLTDYNSSTTVIQLAINGQRRGILIYHANVYIHCLKIIYNNYLLCLTYSRAYYIILYVALDACRESERGVTSLRGAHHDSKSRRWLQESTRSHYQNLCNSGISNKTSAIISCAQP